ncbi:MAG: hypothetical protein KAS38_02730 [Anaerolineales bacterium]|nr:hypothetical protein [Anaerolineales bacterium]
MKPHLTLQAGIALVACALILLFTLSSCTPSQPPESPSTEEVIFHSGPLSWLVP